MNKKNMIRLLSLAVIGIIVGLDQLFKYLVVLYLKPIDNFMLIPGVLQLHYHENDGAMMGMMDGRIEIMTVLSLICMVIIIGVILSGKMKPNVEYVCLVLIAAGGIGNIIDRVFNGFVIDYIEVLFIDFYIFNFADCFITCASFLLLFYEIYQIIKDARKKKEKA